MGKKKQKKVSKFFILFFILGAMLGVGASFIVTRNDCFKLNGDKELILNVGDEYVEEGIKVIEFGKDKSNDINIKIYDVSDEEVDNVDTSIESEYTIVYTIDTFKWADYKLVRKVIVGGGNNE